MATTFQRGDQDGLESGFRWQLERWHYAQQRCRWHPASGVDREDEIMRRAMAEVDAPQSARGRAGHRGECNCIACRERRRLRNMNGK